MQAPELSGAPASRLVFNLQNFIIIRAETHRNHFLFVYVDFFFFNFWFLETPNIGVGLTLPQGCDCGGS